jgi:signal transduction histidine kinase/CheY-like chemotaxis protein
LTIFLPRTRRDAGPQLSGFRPGDRIRVTGIASQYCTLPPYDRYFEVLIPSPSAVVLLERGWLIQPPVLLAALILAAALAAIWWFRENRMATLRKQMRLLNALGEEVISASSPAEVLRRLTSTLPALASGASVELFILNRGTKTLEGVHSTSQGERIDPEAPHGPMASAVAACFRKRTLMAMPDTRRSSGVRNDGGVAAPRSVLLIPMLAQNELMGVLELHHSERVHYFSDAEQAAMQHLANQVATALKLQEQQAIREQLFRSEKLAAAGQLISDVAHELRSPLESIALLASSIQSGKTADSNHELESIAEEARRASDTVSRLVSFAKAEQSHVEPVDVNALLNSLLKFRAPEWKAKGIEIRSLLSETRAEVMVSPGQLEQVLLNLLVEAEKSASEAQEKTILVSSGLLARRVLVEISTARAPDSQRLDAVDHNPGSEALGLGVCRGIIQGYGGEFREVRLSPSQVRFEVELPMTESMSAGLVDVLETAGACRQLTVLIVEPDTKIQRQLVQLLGARGNRVVPVSSAEEGADVAQRLRFDIVICALRLPGLNWVEFFERVRHRVGGFVLLTDGFDQALGMAFKNGEGFVLTKPIDEAELLRVCRTIEERATVNN